MEKQREVTEVADNRGNYFFSMSLHFRTEELCCFLFTNIFFPSVVYIKHHVSVRN